jgi:hypothetical protein
MPMTDSDEGQQKFPTHQDIERRAYEIYLERGQEDGHADEHWLAAEEQLLRKRGERVATPLKTATVVAGAGGTAKIPSPSDSDLLNADEELSQVRASEELKEERERSTLPRIKPEAVGQQKPK